MTGPNKIIMGDKIINIKKKKYYFNLIFFSFIFFTLLSEIPKITDILKYSDEILMISSFLIFIFLNTIYFMKYGKIKKLFLVFIFYFFYQFINFYASPFNLKIIPVLLQSLINIKVFLVPIGIFLLLSERITIYDRRIIKLIFYIMICLFFIGWIGNLIIGERWNIWFNSSPDYRYGILRVCGFFGHPSQQGYLFSLTFTNLILLSNKKIIIKISSHVKKFFLFFLVNFFMAFLLTVRKEIFIIIPYGISTFSIVKGYKKYIYIFLFLIIILTFLFFIRNSQMFQDTLMNLSDMVNPETSYVRGLMFYYGWWLFFHFFPFGTGNATFGTVMSQYNTFDVYNFVGLNMNRFYYKAGTLQGVYDSGIGSFVAENGFIGLCLIIIFLFYYFQYFKKIFDDYNYMIFKIITWFTIILSLTEPVWQNGLYTVFYLMNLLYIYTKNNKILYKGKWYEIR